MLVTVARGAATDLPGQPVADLFNYVLGTQTFGVKYHFTDQTRLVETADRILEMGSNILKIAVGPAAVSGHYCLPERDDVKSLRELVEKEPSFRAVLDKPFAYYLFWANPFHGAAWRDGVSDTERDREYREIYDLGRFLLERYAGSGKSFYLGHWEGDWLLLGKTDSKLDPTPEAIRGMIDWLNIRQKAVDDARRDASANGVFLFNYTEVNLVQRGIKGRKCVTNAVLPHTDVDFVSYSSYDSTGPRPGGVREPLFKALDYIESQMKPKATIPGKRVFIGEYGYPLQNSATPDKQDQYARELCTAAIEWGCPFTLYWEVYCNEILDGKHRGFWLIDDKNRKQPFYFTLSDYYRKMRRFAAEFEKANGRPPTPDESRHRAIAILNRAEPSR